MTSLRAGDCAFVGMNTVPADEFAILFFPALSTGTYASVTNRGADSSGVVSSSGIRQKWSNI